MNNQEINANLCQITSLFNQIIALLKERHRYFDTLNYLTGIFQTELDALESLKDKKEYSDNTNAFLTIIQHACQNFVLLCQLLHERTWFSVSISLDLDIIFDGINDFLKTIYEHIRLLNIDIEFPMNFPPDKLDHDIIEDIFWNLYSYFIEAKKQEHFNEYEKKKIDSQLAQIPAICDRYNVAKPEFSRTVVAKSSFPLNTLNDNGLPKWVFDPSILTDVDDPNNAFKDSQILPFKTKDNKTILKFEFQKDQDIDLENYKKRFMLLSTIKYSDILEFLGGSVQKGTIVCAFKYIQNMLSLTKDFLSRLMQSPRQRTIIAYKIAEGLHFLHSHKIVHGNLDLQSVILRIPVKGVYVYLWNFGLSNKNDVNYKLLPPEFYINNIFNPELGSETFKGGTYTFETDVYQYGLLLYHIGKNEQLYNNTSLNDIKEIIRNPQNKPHFTGEKGKEYFSDNMKKLIEDCLNIDPSKRPTFSEIMKRFETTKLYYIREGMSLNGINDYFYSVRFASRLKIPTGGNKFNSLLEDFRNSEDEEDKNRIIQGLLRLFSNVVDEKPRPEGSRYSQMDEIVFMNNYGFFLAIIPLFIEQNDEVNEELIGNYTKLVTILKGNNDFDLNKLVNGFLTHDGNKLICQLLNQEGKLRDLTLSFLDAINDNLVDEDEEPLSIIITKLIEIKKVKNVCQIIQKVSPNVRTKLLSPVIKDVLPLFNPEHYDDSSFLIESYFENSTETIDVGSILPTSVLRSGKFNLLHHLMKLDNFLSSIKKDDCNEAIRIIISEDAGQPQKECAFLLCLGLEKEFYSVIAKYNKIVDIVLNNENQELASRFIARLTLFSNPCAYILANLENDQEKLPYKHFIELNNPWYLVSLSRIAGFFPNRVSKLPNLKENLIRNLKQADLLEGTLRLLGVLSTEKIFWEDCEVAKSLIFLLLQNSTTYLETSILLSIISNITSINSVKEFLSEEENYFEFLSIAENEGKNSGICLRILSRLPFPENPKRGKEILHIRLVQVVQRHLTNGDKFGIDGSANLIIEMIKHNEELRADLQNANIANLIITNASKENQDINIFIDLMKALNTLGNEKHPEVVSLFSNMIMCYKGALPDEFYRLKNEMSA